MIKISYSNGDIYVLVSNNINFNIEFLINMAQLIKLLEPLKNQYNKVTFKLNKASDIDNLVLAYIFNICTYIKNNMKINVFMSKNLYNRLTGTISNKSGNEYKTQEFKQEVVSNDIKHYILHGENEFNIIVNDLTKLIMNTNIIMDEDNVKLFLKTTIGEVFSNACIHNNINEYYYFKEIIHENSNFYLIVNIVDYGNTIKRNVLSYCKNKNQIYPKNCIDWAVESGNTTRKGSGGYGLPTLLDYIKKVEGDLTVLSANEIFSLKNGNRDFQDKINGYFPGTAICFKIKLYDLDKSFSYDKKNNTLSTRRINLNDI